MAYDKYKKVKSNGNKTSASQGLKNLNNYITDKEKTALPHEKANNNSGSASLKAISDYVENDMKIINPENMQHLVSAINCMSPDTFVSECEELEKLYHSHKTERLNKGASAIHAYHLINSFKGTDIDPEIVHQAGIDLARALCGEDFAAKICTHLNTDNYHNHIVINAYSNDASRKFKDEFHMYKKIRELSNAIARQYGLEVIETTGLEQKSISELLEKWEPQKGTKSVYREFKKDIKQCQEMSISFDDFKSKMLMAGYELREERDNLIFYKDGYQASSRSLGARFYKESITAFINISVDKKERKNFQRFLEKEASKQAANDIDLTPIRIPKFDDNGNRIPWLIRLLKLVLMYLQRFGNTYLDASAPEKYPNNPSLGYANDKIRLVQQTLELLEEYRISSKKGLDDFTNRIGYQLQTSQNNIWQLSATLEKINSVISEIEKEDFFAKLLKDEHIDPDHLESPKVTLSDTRKCIASLNPISLKQKKQLWNVLQNSDYSLRDSMDTLSRMDAEKILSFLKTPNNKIPDMLISKKEHQQNRAYNILKIRSKDYISKMEQTYQKTEATDRQKQLLKSQLSPEQYAIISRKKITKALANRALSYIAKRPIIKEYDGSDFVPPTKWMLRTMQDIKSAFPDDFTGAADINITKIDKNSANKLISYYMAKFDDPFTVTSRKEKPDMDKITLDDLPEEMKSIGNAYLEIQKIKKSFSINTAEDLQKLKELSTTLSVKLNALEENVKDMNSLYGTLKKTQSIINRCASKMFLCGPLFDGNGDFINDSIENLGSDALDIFADLMNEFPDVLRKCKVENIEKSSLASGLFIPPEPEVILYLTRLKESVPEVFITSEGSPISVRLLSSFEAADFLENLEKSGYLKAKYQKLVHDETLAEIRKEQKRNAEEFLSEILKENKI